MLKPSLDDLIKSSVRSILKNKGRTILTSLGIIIGVTSVILLTSIGNGLQVYINQQFESLGSNSIFVVPGKVFDDKGGFNNSESARYITAKFRYQDITTLRRNLRNSLVLPQSIAQISIKQGSVIKKDITLIGVNSQYGDATNITPPTGNGRWFTKEEDDKKTPVVVMGYKIAQDLFPNGNIVGKRVNVNGKNLKVVGFNEKKGGSFGGPNLDEYLFAPIGLVQGFAGNDDIVEIIIKTPTKEEVEATKVEVKKILLKDYDEDAFSVFDSSQLLNSINAIIGTLTIALAGIAAISLVVGGIGIMNIMLVTVSERTKEIGLRKAIGAYPRAILIQFLIEAVILSCLGGFIGVALGWLGSLAINNFFPARVTFSSVAIAFGVSALVGIIFGVAPARRASKLSPIEALRYE